MAETGPPQGPLLALDTATPQASVAVGVAGRVLAEVMLGVDVRHSEALLPAIAFVLDQARLKPAELTGVAVGSGPGSFTGVRIAAATAKGLVHGLGTQLFAYPSLLVLAAGAATRDRAVCALFDARRGEVYAACYRFPGMDAVVTELAPAGMGVDSVLEHTLALDPLYVGEGARLFAERITARGGIVAEVPLAVPRASSLLWLTWRAPLAGRVRHPASWEPAYLRPSGARPPAR
jgi:tRNA threonylcarbamoyladenosine biosynthesis protein TsaB